MSDVVIASDREDAEAAERVVLHHAELAGRLATLVRTTTRATDAAEVLGGRDRLVDWARSELLPHAEAEERSLYPAAAQRRELAVLVQEMVAEHHAIRRLVEMLEGATSTGDIVATAGGLQAVLDVHLHKENEAVLPALVASADHSVAGLLDGMHAILGETPATEAPTGHACTCSEDEDVTPELDARSIPHAVRHATVFGALGTVAPGSGLVLLAPHDPLPLLNQLAQREPDAFDVDYLERGPETWRLRFRRRSPAEPSAG
ncbi:DUF2249 domain-containing protein [Actinophytocola sp. KF-1]